jgi:hypothetical protein
MQPFKDREEFGMAKLFFCFAGIVGNTDDTDWRDFSASQEWQGTRMTRIGRIFLLRRNGREHGRYGLEGFFYFAGMAGNTEDTDWGDFSASLEWQGTRMTRIGGIFLLRRNSREHG